jgi:hypothetical protein
MDELSDCDNAPKRDDVAENGSSPRRSHKSSPDFGKQMVWL